MEENIKKYGILRNQLRVAKETKDQVLCDEIQKKMTSLAKSDEDLSLYEREYLGDVKVWERSSKARDISDMIYEAELHDAYNLDNISIQEYMSLIEEVEDVENAGKYLKWFKLHTLFKKKYGKSIEIARLEEECGISIDSQNFPVEILFAKAFENEKLENEYFKSKRNLYMKTGIVKKEYVNAYGRVKGISDMDAGLEYNKYKTKLSPSHNEASNNTHTIPSTTPKAHTMIHSVSCVSGYIIVNEAISEIEINGRKYPFSKIIDFKVNDNSKTFQSPAAYETKKSTSSMLGRALVGGLLTGGWGAIVGAATAKSKTVQTEGATSTTYHNYSIIISIDDISNPTETLEVKYDQRKVEEISSILNVIINKNKQLHTQTPPAMQTHAGNSVADELIKLAELKKQGLLTEEEFNQQKNKLLNR